MDRPIIVVTESYDDAALQRLGEVGDVRVRLGLSPAELRAAIGDAHALLVRTYTRVTGELISAAPKLRVIGRGGVGLENVDTAAATARGIAVVYTPAAATRAVAELTVGLILALERRIVHGDAEVRAGRFAQARAATIGRELHELTLGIVGMGRIGREVGRICHTGFGMPVVYNDLVEVGWLDFVATPVSKEQLWAEADVISLHVPLTPQTEALVSADVLAKLKPTALLINTCRGKVVDAAALAEALHAGRLAGAAIDVFDVEPPPPDHPLLRAPSLLLSPHAAARTRAGLTRMSDCVDDVIAVLNGGQPRFPFAPGRS